MIPELSPGNKVLIGMLMAVLATWGSRTYFYTRHLKTEAQVQEEIKRVQQEEATKRSEVMVKNGEAYKQIDTLQKQLNTLKKSRGSKKTLPDGTIIEDWESEESSSLVEKAMRDLQDQAEFLSNSLVESNLKITEVEENQKKLQQRYDEAILEKQSLQKRVTILAGWNLNSGTWQQRLKLGGLLHLGVASVGLSIAPASAINEFTKPLDSREENGWLNGLEPMVWGGWSF